MTMTLLDMISRFTSNELFLRRWLGIFTSPPLAELADEMLDVQEDLDKARDELWIAIRTMVLDLAQAAAIAFPETPLGSSDMAVEMIYAMLVAQRRSQRAQERETASFRLVVAPLDGGKHDEEHLEIVARASAGGVPVNGAWQAMQAELAACKRPAIAWAPDHEVHLDLDGQDAESEEAVPDDGSETAATAPVPLRDLTSEEWATLGVPRAGTPHGVACSNCIPLGPTRDEDGGLCSLFLCECANDGTILVESLTRPPRAVPCALVRTVPLTSPAPQVEALRRADAAGLTGAP